MKLINQGYSLMELMVVVCIISILALIATPSYQGYIQRARFAEIMAATAPYKIAVSLALQEGYPLTELNSGEHGIPLSISPTSNIANIQVKSGIIIATATSLLNHITYILKPQEDGTWHIGGSCIKSGLCNA